MSDELQLIVKSLFAMKINLIPKKAISTAFPPCHHCLSSVNHGNLQGNMCNHHCFVKKEKKKKNGFTGKDIAAVRLHLSQRFTRSSQSSWRVVKKASGQPRKSSKCQDCLLKVIQLRDCGTTSAELAQKRGAGR